MYGKELKHTQTHTYTHILSFLPTKINVFVYICMCFALYVWAREFYGKYKLQRNWHLQSEVTAEFFDYFMSKEDVLHTQDTMKEREVGKTMFKLLNDFVRMDDNIRAEQDSK